MGFAERPLLLTLMASLHAWRGGSLPEKREELYADTIDLLLDWWEGSKVKRNRQGEATAREPSLSEWLKTDRQTLMDKRGEGVRIILENSKRLSGKEPEYRLIDGAELLLTIHAAGE